MAWSLLSLFSSRRTWVGVVVVGIAFIVSLYLTTYHRGMIVAHLDHARGHYEVKAHGYVDGATFEYGRLLYRKYGVTPNIYGGCVVDATTSAYEAGYNSVSERLLIKKFGKNIFAECAAEARPELHRWRNDR